MVLYIADTSQNSQIDFAEFVHYVLEHEKKIEVVFKVGADG